MTSPSKELGPLKKSKSNKENVSLFPKLCKKDSKIENFPNTAENISEEDKNSLK